MGGSSLLCSLPVTAALLVCLVTVNARQLQPCPNGKGVCAPREHCLEKHGTGRRVAFYKCLTNENQLGVCCKKLNPTLNSECITSRGGPGRCLPDDQCGGGYTRDFLLGIESENWWKSEVCYQDAQVNYYCCPPELQKSTQKVRSRISVQSSIDNVFQNCSRSDKELGRCVPMRLCDNFRTKVLDRQMGWTYENLPPHYRCHSDASDSTSMCCSNPEKPYSLIEYRKVAQLHPQNCGSLGMPGRVMRDDEAGLGAFPWMANLMYYEGFNKTTFCSGSLIHAQYVLTAAHCLKPRKPISVRLGEHDLSKMIDCMGETCAQPVREYNIGKFIIHKEYENKVGDNDIALIKLSIPARISKGHIYPICLPITRQWLMTTPAKLIVSGWGLMKNVRFPDVLRHATLQTLKKREWYCRKEQSICTRGTSSEGNCRGDSGGPLQQIMPYQDKYRMVLFGVSSGGAKNCTVDTMANVSVLVGYHMRWILDNMEI